MRTKTIPVGQLIIEGLGDTDNAYEYVSELMPLIGEVVLWFNTLEADIDNILCGFISDRTDQKGLLVVGNMMYATKLDLFERFTSDVFRGIGDQPVWFSQLLSDLRECGSLRNKVVHANWMHTNEDGYTQVKIKFSKRGLEHELVQFSKDSLELIIGKIEAARDQLDYLNVEFLSC
ncbi:hypothetical protein SAMN05216496_2273 [Pseudomonas sp. Z003-0.4C(8344-21)]|jgi:hypothetical protein|uniref:hypothetical protein n=1 Tax=Pseudomonas sp. Z003-0.4C(8344-21) TaxID=1855380 RepID=UPI000879B404|nr:hypothetical protein [Pseudomonas sp. Z003-0.4C(8344-21)]SDS73155.1 hypothetical protein SAMN05216496_2273 [Pseudomonas sp. Z003-0.4C(8344-21)]